MKIQHITLFALAAAFTAGCSPKNPPSGYDDRNKSDDSLTTMGSGDSISGDTGGLPVRDPKGSAIDSAGGDPSKIPDGAKLAVSDLATDYRPGDLVTWMLPGNLPHVGIVIDRMSSDGARPLIVHNIGAGPRIEDALFAHPITGHYRYMPAER